jgi:peroxiredoxin
MANNLTGDYETVLQVSVRQINGLLATLHQNGGQPGKSPSFPHQAVRMAVGGLPKVLDPHIVRFSNWLGHAAQSLRASGPAADFASPLEIGAHYAEKAPPGAVAKFNQDLHDLVTARDEVMPSGSVRGLADVQISTPAISLQDSEVVVHAYIRAHYYPEGTTPPLPEPIHGEVRIRYAIEPKTVNGKKVMEVAIPSDNNKIQFFPAPGSGVSQADADNAIAVHIRAAIRERFKATPVELPGDFKFFEFKGLGSFGNLHDPHWVDALGSGAEQALALPMQLTDNPAAADLTSVANLFLGTGPSQSDFAIAVGKEHVLAKFQPTLDALRQIHRDFVIEIPIGTNPTYHLSVTSVDLQFNVGSIDLIIHAKAVTGADPFPSFNNIVIIQRITLMLIGTSVIVQAFDSDLTITGLPSEVLGFDVIGRAKNALIAERDKALPAAKAALTDAFQKTSDQLNDAMKSFDDSASARYLTIEVNPDGILLRGNIDTKMRNVSVLAHPGETDNGKSFTALEAWIPGGRIDRYRWWWCEDIVNTTPSGVMWTWPFDCDAHGPFDVPHSFIFSKPAALQDRPLWSSGICFAIEGTQVMPDGKTQSIVEQWGTCKPRSREPVVVLDPRLYALYENLGWPEPPAPDGVLQEAIGGHVNIQAAQAMPAGGPGANTLVYFAGSQAARPLETLDRALTRIRRRDFALTFSIVMPMGTFAGRRREVEERLGLTRESGQQNRPQGREELLSVPLVITEDSVLGWTRAFGVRETPAVYLVNARGEFVWKQNGILDAAKLAPALDQYLLPSRHHPPRPLRLAVQPGEPALDATFADDRGQILALRRLLGKCVMLLFWQSWSLPCVKEMRRLQQLQNAGGEHPPLIVAVNGGEGRDAIAEFRRQYQPTIMLVPDPDQRIAELYGVACWPTTVSINPDGIVDRVQFGVSHLHRGASRDRA